MAGVRLRLSAAILMATVLAIPGPVHAAGKLKLGAVLPLTGDASDIGGTVKTAVVQAVDDINKSGGVLGSPIALVIEDDQGLPKAGVDAARKLTASEKVAAIIGPIGGEAFTSIAKDLAAAASIPVVTGGATAVNPVESKGFAFRTGPADVLQGAGIAETAKDKGYETVGVLHANSERGNAIADGFAKSYAKLGGKVAANLAFEGKQRSLLNELKSVSSSHPDALLVIADAGDGTRLVKQALDGGFFNKFLLSDDLKHPGVIEKIGGQFLDGAAGASAVTTAQAFTNAVYVVALAAEKAKSADGVKIRDAIREVTGNAGEKIGPGDFAKAKQLLAQGKKIAYAGANGALAFDAHGDIGGPFTQWEFRDGTINALKVFQPKP